MPYICQTERDVFKPFLDELGTVVKKRGLSNGDLNYLMTMLSQLYIKQHGSSYNTLSDVIKALECAKLEFYARLMRPYEDLKIEQNGDVYHPNAIKRRKKKEVSLTTPQGESIRVAIP